MTFLKTAEMRLVQKHGPREEQYSTFLKTAEMRLVRMRRPRDVDWCQSWWKKMDWSCMDRKRAMENR